MEVSIEDISSLTRKITVTVPGEEVQPKLNAEYDKVRKDVKIKGYRRGKVPRELVVKSYKLQVENEVGEKLVQETYFDAIEKEKIDPVTHPEISSIVYNEDGSFTYIAHVDVRPVFELGEYKGLEIEKTEAEVSEAEIQKELEIMQREMAALRSVEDRAIAAHDVVVIDFQGYHKGNAIKQVKNENYSIDVGSGKMGVEFEQKLIGMKKGEEASHEVSYQDTHPNPFLKGRTIQFKIAIKDVKERVLADLDDEFAKDVDKSFATLDDLKNSIREHRLKERTNIAEGMVTDRIMQKLLENYDFEVPNRLVAFEIEQMIKETEQQLERNGYTLEAAGISKDKLVEENKEIAQKRVRGDFLLKKIAEAEKIKVEEEDLERSFKRIGDQYKMSVAEVKEYFKSRNDLLPLMNELLNEKVLNFLKEQSKFVVKTAEVKEAEA